MSLHSFISYRTGHYKLHYYETPTSLKFVMVTDTKTSNLRIVLHQIYVGLYVEYGRRASFFTSWQRMQEWSILKRCTNWIPVVKNPLAPVEHPGGLGVNCEMFELGLEQFIVSSRPSSALHFAKLIAWCIDRNPSSPLTFEQPSGPAQEVCPGHDAWGLS